MVLHHPFAQCSQTYSRLGVNVSGFVLASSVNAGGAERLVELGILVKVFCAGQRE
jgi:hypothetical protein